MKIRAALLTLVLAAGLGVTAGSALAVDEPGGPGPRDPQARCERAQSQLEKLQALQARIEGKIAEIQAKIDSGELTEEQLARAREALTKLQARLERVSMRIRHLEARIAEHCAGPGGGPTETV